MKDSKGLRQLIGSASSASDQTCDSFVSEIETDGRLRDTTPLCTRKKRLNHSQNYAKERGRENVSNIRIVSNEVNEGLTFVPLAQKMHMYSPFLEKIGYRLNFSRN